jgi:putative transposase
LAGRIEKIFNDNHGNYGSPRVYEALRASGEKVNHKRVERIMRDSGLVGEAARLYRRKALPERLCIKKPNLKLKMPAPIGINQQWVGDITYLRVNNEWRYLAVVMDLYSRRIIDWSLGCYKSAELTRSAIVKALSHRKVEEGLIFHTDRGPEYGAYLIQDELTRAGIRPSMNRPKSITDNIHI